MLSQAYRDVDTARDEGNINIMSGTANGTDSSGNSGKQSDDKKGSWKGAVGCGICSAAVLFGLSGVAIWVEDVFAHGRLPDTLQQDCFAMTAILLVGAFAGMFFQSVAPECEGTTVRPQHDLLAGLTGRRVDCPCFDDSRRHLGSGSLSARIVKRAHSRTERLRHSASLLIYGPS